MRRTLIATLMVLAGATCLLVVPSRAEAQFFFGGLFAPCNNVVVVNNNGGFGGQSVVAVRQRGFLFPRNDVLVVNNVNNSRSGFRNQAFVVRRRVFFNTFSACGF